MGVVRYRAVMCGVVLYRAVMYGFCAVQGC